VAEGRSNEQNATVPAVRRHVAYYRAVGPCLPRRRAQPWTRLGRPVHPRQLAAQCRVDRAGQQSAPVAKLPGSRKRDHDAAAAAEHGQFGARPAGAQIEPADRLPGARSPGLEALELVIRALPVGALTDSARNQHGVERRRVNAESAAAYVALDGPAEAPASDALGSDVLGSPLVCSTF